MKKNLVKNSVVTTLYTHDKLRVTFLFTFNN